MKFALDKSTLERIEATKKGLIAICECCGKAVDSKPGNIKVAHWAHRKGQLRECDPWWENETPWHRSWKDKFPKTWQENIMYDSIAREKHRADIYNPNMDLVIEFQNSPLDIKEREAREKFYKKMIWVVNAQKFKFQTFSIKEWDTDVVKFEKKFFYDVRLKHRRVLNKTNKEYRLNLIEMQKSLEEGTMFMREGESLNWNINVSMKKNIANFYGDISKSLQDFVEELEKYREKNKAIKPDDHFILYNWIYRRINWEITDHPVFFDLGHRLILLKSKFIGQKVSIDKFIKKYG